MAAYQEPVVTVDEEQAEGDVLGKCASAEDEVERDAVVADGDAVEDKGNRVSKLM